MAGKPVKKGPDMRSHPDASPFNALPPVVVALAVALLGIEVVLSLGERGVLGGPGAIGWRLEALESFGFYDEIFAWMFETGRWEPEHLIRFVTYPFVHFNFTHMLLVVVFLLALGKMVGEAMGGAALLVLFFGSAVGAAVVYTVLLDTQVPLVGGYPAVYGLIGGYTYILWMDYGRTGQSQFRAFTLIGFLLGIQLVFGVIFGSDAVWLGELAGFATGFGLSFVVAPGGWRRLRERLRQR